MFVAVQSGLGPLLGTPLGKLLLAIVALSLVVVIGKFVLNVAARLLKVAGVVVLVIWLLSVVPDVMAGF